MNDIKILSDKEEFFKFFKVKGEEITHLKTVFCTESEALEVLALLKAEMTENCKIRITKAKNHFED